VKGSLNSSFASPEAGGGAGKPNAFEAITQKVKRWVPFLEIALILGSSAFKKMLRLLV
jgi:hypothetical protein